MGYRRIAGIVNEERKKRKNERMEYSPNAVLIGVLFLNSNLLSLYVWIYKQGQTTASYFWPGSEAVIKGSLSI